MVTSLADALRYRGRADLLDAQATENVRVVLEDACWPVSGQSRRVWELARTIQGRVGR